jgi:dihydroneopterin triphosphate diphosphatase
MPPAPGTLARPPQLGESISHMPSIVSRWIQVHIARFREDRVEYLLLQRSDEESAYPGVWQVVTGGIEEGETAEAAARRELMEETGLVHETLWAVPYVASFFDAKRDAINLVPVFAVVVAPDVEPTLSEEHKDFYWATYEEAMERLIFPTHHEGTRIVRDYLLHPSSQLDFMKL